MRKINWPRIFLGGLLAGVVINLLVTAQWELFLKKAEMEVATRSQPQDASIDIFYLVFNFIIGILCVLLYAFIRPRYGPGPKTAALAGGALWLFFLLLAAVLVGGGWLGPPLPLRLWALTFGPALIILVVAAMVGAWVYKERST